MFSSSSKKNWAENGYIGNFISNQVENLVSFISLNLAPWFAKLDCFRMFEAVLQVYKVWFLKNVLHIPLAHDL